MIDPQSIHSLIKLEDNNIRELLRKMMVEVDGLTNSRMIESLNVEEDTILLDRYLTQFKVTLTRRDTLRELLR